MVLRTPNSALALLLSIGALAAAGCILTPAGIQLLELHFGLSETLFEGEAALVHQQVIPGEVVLKKYQVRASGWIRGATNLPDRVDVLVTAEGVDDGKIYDRFKLKVKIDADGGFSATGKWKKNIQARTLLSAFLTPVGTDLSGDVDIDVCIQMTKLKGTLNQVADCAPGSFNLIATSDPDLQSPGYHEFITVEGAFPADLGATAGRELVVALRDKNRPGQVCPNEVPWDGCASVDWDDVDGARNAPAGGGYFENKLILSTESGRLVLFMNQALGLERELDDDFALG